MKVRLKVSCECKSCCVSAVRYENCSIESTVFAAFGALYDKKQLKKLLSLKFEGKRSAKMRWAAYPPLPKQAHESPSKEKSCASIPCQTRTSRIPNDTSRNQRRSPFPLLNRSPRRSRRKGGRTPESRGS